MRRSSILMMAALLATAAPAANAQRKLGTLEFTPCTLSAGVMPDGVDAQCTTLKVPEDRAKPDGRQVELAIAWVPSEVPQGAPDPVFMLAGGPGQAARESYPMIERAFRQVLKTRHVILVDQRGTGQSNPLVCKGDDGKSAVVDGGASTDDPAAFRAFAEKCARELDADARFYTTSDAVLDLDAVRAALSAEQIDLVGISYGTRVAQEYVRRFPKHARAVIIDGVVPPMIVLGGEFGQNLDDSLDRQFARCAATPTCAERFGKPRETLDALLAKLREAPVPTTYRDPLTGEVKQEDFTADHLVGLVRLFAYDPRVASMLPMALAEASAGRFDVLMAQAHLVGDMMQSQIMHGMQLSVICAEDAPLMTEPSETERNTTMGAQLVTLMREQCAVWPRGRMPDDFHAPLATDVPVLLLSGEFDPVTPPRYADDAAKSMKNARHLVVRGRGHNVLGTGCMPRVIDRFLREPTKELDAKCLEQLDYLPPFAGSYGPEP